MNRGQGVAVPQGQLRSGRKGEPNRVLNAVQADLVAVAYTDKQGNEIKEFWYKVGDTLYIPPGAEQFASQLRPAKGVFAEQVLAKLAARETGPAAGLPVQDDVDVVSTQTAQQSGRVTEEVSV